MFDSLFIVGFPILGVDFVEYVIDGLDPKYQFFITSLHFRPSTIFNELYDLLIHKKHLQKKLVDMSCLIVAMIAT